MRRSALFLIGCLASAAPLGAQDLASYPTVPATKVLALRESLSLDSAQLVRLQALERIQTSALARATADFYRAEADVVESMRSDDPVARRTALEKRSRVAIENELASLKWDKEARAILTPKQVAELAGIVSASARGRQTLWHSLVTPLNIAPPPAVVADSGELRVSVNPNYADIYVNGEKRGTGRRFLTLPVGNHEVTASAVNCERKSARVVIAKNEATVLSQTLTCAR